MMTQPKTISLLHMDADAALGQRVQRRLEQEGYRVAIAPDGQTGLDMHAAHNYDVLVIKQALPVHSGLDVLRILASWDAMPLTLMLADVANEKTAIEALNLGASDYVVADAQGDVVDLLAVTLNRARQRRGLVEDRQRAVEAQRAREQFLTLLNDITRTSLENLNSPTMLKTLSGRLAQALEADGCFFALWDENTQRPFLPSSESGTIWRASSPSLLLDPGAVPLTKAVLSAQCPVIVEDVRASPYISQSLAERMPAHALLVLPLIAGQQKLGAVSVGFVGPHLFTAEEIERAEQAAHHIALAIAKAQLLEETELRYREAETLRQASATVTAIASLDATLARILEQLANVVAYTCASIQLLRRDEAADADAVTGYLEIVSERGFPDTDTVIGRRFAIPGDTAHTQVVQSREPVFAAPVSPSAAQACAQSWLGVPLIVHDDLIGILALNGTQPGHFNQDHIRIVTPFANQAAIAINNAQLVEALRQRTAELEMRNEELDAFAHTVAHDLKSPLTAVTGYGGLLETHFKTLPEEEVLRLLGIIAQNGHKMSKIIDSILLLATVHKLGGVNMAPLDMTDIVAEAQSRIVDLIEDRQATLLMPDTWPQALGYAPWVEEIWANYLSNGVKYGGSRDGSTPPRVELGADLTEDPAPMVRFWACDNGPGISQEAQKRLFTLFTRLDAVRAQGHGLGLSIVQRIAGKMGGNVGVESQPGHGSTFWFTLPACEES